MCTGTVVDGGVAGIVDPAHGVLVPVFVIAVREVLAGMRCHATPCGSRRKQSWSRPWPSRFCSSIVSIRSEFHTSERSETLTSAKLALMSRIALTPFASGFASSEHRGVVLHRPLHVVADHRSRGAAMRVAQLVEVGQRLVAGIAGQWLVRRARLDRLGAAVGHRATEHHQVEQRVGAEAVRAVHGHASGLADRVSGRAPPHPDCRCTAAPLRRGNWSGCRPCCSARSGSPGSAASRHRRRRRSARLGDAGQLSWMSFGSRWVRSRWMWSLCSPTPRPSRISMVIERETTSREARSLAFGA